MLLPYSYARSPTGTAACGWTDRCTTAVNGVVPDATGHFRVPVVFCGVQSGLSLDVDMSAGISLVPSADAAENQIAFELVR